MAWITITHPETGGTHTCTEEAFDLVWEEKGWKRVDSRDELSKKTVAQLTDLASQLGIDTGSSTKKADIVDALLTGMTSADTNPANATSEEA